MISLVCTFEPLRIPLVRQFVEHYTRLGVDRFFLSLQVEPDLAAGEVGRARSEASETLRKVEQQLHAVLAVPFTAQALCQNHDRIRTQECGQDDWIVWADLDEFQVYPGDFKSLLGLAESYDIDYLRGFFVERAAANGGLKDFDPAQSIWTQYPRRFTPDARIFQRNPEKVVFARPWVECPAPPGFRSDPNRDQPFRAHRDQSFRTRTISLIVIRSESSIAITSER